MSPLTTSKIALTWFIIVAGVFGRTQASTVANKQVECPPELRATFTKTKVMIQKGNAQANALGLTGWPTFPADQLTYSWLDEPCFKDRELDKVWCPRVAYWNLSTDGLRFSAILLMHDLNPAPKAFPSDLDYHQAVYINDAFGSPKLSKIGIRIHNLYRATIRLKSPQGFPKFIGTGDTFEFEDTHDEGGLSSRYVYSPTMGLAIAGMRVETEAEHLAALKAEEGEEEMGDSPGHAGECSGLFIENIKEWRESEGFAWVKSGNTQFAFPLFYFSQSRKKESGKATK